jgi:hypothetical protein
MQSDPESGKNIFGSWIQGVKKRGRKPGSGTLLESAYILDPDQNQSQSEFTNQGTGIQPKIEFF